VAVKFFVQGMGVQPPQLTQPARIGPSQFLFHLNGPTGRNYAVQYATALTNWTTFVITNTTSADTVIIDSAASDSKRIYRAITGP
jgi:hypothetical protein